MMIAFAIYIVRITEWPHFVGSHPG
jgi:hypothetical protein